MPSGSRATDKENPREEVPDLENVGKFKAVTAHDLESFKNVVRVGDALLLLWNCISTRMHTRVDPNGHRLPATNEERTTKANQLQRCEKMYRLAYTMAFGASAFKP